MEKSQSKLEKVHHDHSAAITRNCDFLGYGILIALFHFGKCFFNSHPILATCTAMFSIITLLLVHLFSVYQFSQAEFILQLNKQQNLYNECNESWMERLYQRMRIKSICVFWLFQFTLIISVIFFLVSSFFFFYGEQSSCS